MHGDGPGRWDEAEKVVPTYINALHAVTWTVSPGLQAKEGGYQITWALCML